MRNFTIAKRVITAGLICLTMLGAASADILVIVHPDNTSSIDVKFIKNLYVGKETRFSSGDEAIPLMLEDGNELADTFLKELVKQKPVQFKRLWSKALFTGKGTPPQEVKTNKEMVELVMNNPALVGYIDSENFTNDVRAVIRINTK